MKAIALYINCYTHGSIEELEVLILNNVDIRNKGSRHLGF